MAVLLVLVTSAWSVANPGRGRQQISGCCRRRPGSAPASPRRLKARVPLIAASDREKILPFSRQPAGWRRPLPITTGTSPARIRVLLLSRPAPVVRCPDGRRRLLPEQQFRPAARLSPSAAQMAEDQDDFPSEQVAGAEPDSVDGSTVCATVAGAVTLIPAVAALVAYLR